MGIDPPPFDRGPSKFLTAVARVGRMYGSTHAGVWRSLGLGDDRCRDAAARRCPCARQPGTPCTGRAQAPRRRRACERRGGDPAPPMGGRQHAGRRSAHEPATLGRHALPEDARRRGTSGEQGDRLDDRAPAGGVGCTTQPSPRLRANLPRWEGNGSTATTQLIAGCTGTVTAAISTAGRTASGDVVPVEIIVLDGEFDLSNVRHLERAIQRGIVAGVCDFIADLSDVDFLDGAAVRVLLEGWKHAARHNGDFVLVNPPPRIWRVMVLIGLSRTFARFASRREALAYLRPKAVSRSPMPGTGDPTGRGSTSPVPWRKT